MGNWGTMGANWTSADTLKGSNVVFKELSECWGERSFAEKTASWARIPNWFGGGFNFSSFISPFDSAMQGFCAQNQGYIDHLIQVTDNYWNYNPGAGEVQWGWWYGTWFPLTWTEARYLAVSGDPEIIGLGGFPHGLSSVTPEYLFQKRKILNLCRWAWEWPLFVGVNGNAYPEYLEGQVEITSDFTQIRFRHPKSLVPNAWLSNGASTGKMPPHTWEVWDQRERDMTGYHDMKTRKIYSEVITTDIKSTDADYHYSPWLSVSTIKVPETYSDEWYCAFTQWTFIYKCEAGFLWI